MDDTIRVGELARRTGLTVRTLHHYDELGLLTPAGRTAAGHRLYGSRELRRLQAIVSLRQLGLSLDEIGGWLDAPDDPLPRILVMHLARAPGEDRRERAAGAKALTSETVAGFTGGDPGLRDSLQTLWRENPDAGARWGMDADVMRWAARAVDGS